MDSWLLRKNINSELISSIKRNGKNKHWQLHFPTLGTTLHHVTRRKQTQKTILLKRRKISNSSVAFSLRKDGMKLCKEIHKTGAYKMDTAFCFIVLKNPPSETSLYFFSLFLSLSRANDGRKNTRTHERKLADKNRTYERHEHNLLAKDRLRKR